MSSKLSALVLLLGFSLAGCPPTGDPPAFDPIEGDAVVPDEGPEPDEGPDVAIDALPPDAAPDGAIPDARLPDAAPDGPLPDLGPPPGCIDRDDDGYVEDEGCELPAGDCAPDDPARNPLEVEICNALDDDCDGNVDDGDPGAGEECDTGSPGICRFGLTACEGGQIVCDQREPAEPRETCNELDDDCDGEVDEDDPGGGDVCRTGLEGVCDPGVLRCVSGDIVCISNLEPSPEICNAEDDDCDGEVDEDDPQGGGVCDTGLQGLCAVGVERCVGGAVVCTETVGPQPEICDGLDNNCDGSSDEAFVTLGEACVVGTGACERVSVLVCADDGAGVVCDASAGDGTPELCNGIDDDCDEQIDEGFDLEAACEVGVGACLRVGQIVCAVDQQASECSVRAGQPQMEACDGLDNDCDGEIDEDYPELGTDCVDDSGLCPSPGTFICNPGAGPAVICDAVPVLPLPELCNGLDDDCDGSVDEDFPDLGDLCEPGVGQCQNAGNQICTADGSGTECDVQAGQPIEERCDGLDDDCDGRVDNQARCPSPPTGIVTAWQVAPFGAPGCRDFDGDLLPDNLLGDLGATLNPLLAASLAEPLRSRIVLLRAAIFPPLPGNTVDLELLVGRPEGAGIAVDSRSLDAVGGARWSLPEVGIVNGSVAMPAPAAGLQQIVSPFFHDRDGAYAAWALVSLWQAEIAGTLGVIPPEGGIALDAAVLTAAIPRAPAVEAYRSAASACAAAGGGAPPGCSVFATLDPAGFEALFIADVDTDADGTDDAVSACFTLQVAAAPAIDSPPLAGQACQQGSDCLAGLDCVPVPVLDVANGTALQRRCGVPGSGGGVFGDVCSTHDDCLGRLCVDRTAAGAQCTQLCQDDDGCPLGYTCRGIELDVEGALNRGGASARICVPGAGSGTPCDTPGDCAGGELCGIWLGGQVGVAGGPVSDQGHCQAPDVAGAPLGGICGDQTDCERGNGCPPDDQGALRCAAACRTSADCGPTELCTEVPVSGAFGVDPAILHGFCLPTPQGLGSGARCQGDYDCAVGSSCRLRYLALPGVAEGICVNGDGFFSIGQPCAAPADCASGRCVGGVCGGICTDNADCGPRLGCRPGQVQTIDGGPQVDWGVCDQANVGCVQDVQCNADPVCAGGRCVCEGVSCRVGCRFPGICPGGLFCGPDNRCQVFCRDDEEEPNDQAADATLIPVGRAQPTVRQQRKLCAGSGVDFYRINTGGLPFDISVLPTGGDPDVLLELRLYDELAPAQPIAVGVAGGLPGELVISELDPVAAEAYLATSLLIEVVGAGVVEGVDYTLTTSLTTPGCNDPQVEPRDNPWEWTPLADQPGLVINDTVNAWVCHQDVDYYAVRLENNDTLVLDLTVVGNGVDAGRANLQLELVGPDFAAFNPPVVGSIPANNAGGQVIFQAPPMRCLLQAGHPDNNHCVMGADNRRTPLVCVLTVQEACLGTTYFVRVSGAGPLDYAEYRLDATVQRAANSDCAADPFDHDGVLTTAERQLAGLDPVFATTAGGYPSIVADTDVVVPTLRACQGDLDFFTFGVVAGDTIRGRLVQQGPPERLQLDIYDGFTVELLSRAVGQQQILENEWTAQADGLIAIGMLRTAVSPVVVDYDLTLRRISAGVVPDEGCNNIPRLDLVGGQAVAQGTTIGANADHEPSGCNGGLGRDRIYTVGLPLRAGTLTATVEATGQDGYDPAVSIRTNCQAQASEVACNEDDATAPNPFTRARVSAQVNGGDVLVIVDGFSLDTSGAFRLTVDFQPN